MKRVLPILMTPVVALAGCATVTSQHVGPGARIQSRPPAAPYCDQVAEGETCVARPVAKAGAEGVTYFMPRQLVKVSASRTGGKLAEAVGKVVKANAELDAAKAAVTAAETAVAVAEESLIAFKGGDDGKAILQERLKTAKATLAAKTADVPKKQDAITAAEATVAAAAASVGSGDSANTGPGAYKVTLKMELQAPSADPDQAFTLSPQHNVVRDDEHKLTVSPAGLLTSTDITATGRTADILVELSAFAGAIQGGGLPFKGRDGRAANTAKDCKKSPDTFFGVVDFVDPVSVATLNDDLQCLGVRVAPSGRYWPANSRPAPSGQGLNKTAIEGIAYRTPIEVIVRVEKCVSTDGACGPDTGWLPVEVVALALPQAGPISYVRQDGGFLTKTKYTLAFKDGMLTDYSGSRPSEVLEAARTPMRVIQGGFDGLSKVISLRTGQATSQAGYLTAQKSLLDAEYALKKASLSGDSGLADAELALLRSQIALQAGQIDGQKMLSNAELELMKKQLEVLQQQYAAERAAVSSQTEAIGVDSALLQAQNNLAIARNNAIAQLAANQLATEQALLLTQAKREAMSRCITEKLQASEPYASCLTP